MGKLTFILGGARSGKSSHAQKIAGESGKSVAFIATAQALDDEMRLRIQKHRNERPLEWSTFEIPQGIAAYLREHAVQADIYLLDCLTLLVNNIFMQFNEDDLVDEEKAKQSLENEVDELLDYILENESEWIVISNEVGMGLVPPYQMGRVYRDLLGWANQCLAQHAEKVVFMVAGIPMFVKG